MMNRCAFGYEGSGDLDRKVRLAKVQNSEWRFYGAFEHCGSWTAARQRNASLPQRLHRVCVLLWRLPKELVPFAVVDGQLPSPLEMCVLRLTYSSWIR